MVLMCIIFRKMKSLICKIKPGILYEYKEAVTNYFKELKLANSFDWLYWITFISTALSFIFFEPPLEAPAAPCTAASGGKGVFSILIL